MTDTTGGLEHIEQMRYTRCISLRIRASFFYVVDIFYNFSSLNVSYLTVTLC